MGHTNDILGRMTPGQKVGQLLMLAFDEQDLAEPIERLHAGCLIVWNSNVHGPRACAELANRIQEQAVAHRGVPLWLHGFVEDLGWSGAWQAALPTVADADEVERIGRVFGRRWRAAGLHNFPAPTVNVPIHDTCIMRTWAMTGDADLVTRYGEAATRGLVSQRCGTMAQHFPAHGATPVDSHKGFPVVDLARDVLMRDHVRPYQAAFEAGCTSICAAHIACTALDPDPDHVATTSHAILTDFLRGELGFEGIAIADAVSMTGFHKNGPPEVVCVDAVVAGCDSICIAWPGPMRTQVFDALLAAVRSGVISADRLDEAVARNLRFIEWLGLLDNPYVDPERAEAVFADADDVALLDDINARLKAKHGDAS